jgi:hypothetical protein
VIWNDAACGSYTCTARMDLVAFAGARGAFYIETCLFDKRFMDAYYKFTIVADAGDDTPFFTLLTRISYTDSGAQLL